MKSVPDPASNPRLKPMGKTPRQNHFGTTGALRGVWIGQILNYFLSLGRTMFSTIASSAAGTIPEPPKM